MESKQPKWRQPEGGRNKGLMVSNSLAKGDGLVPFVPAKGNRVAWYICGPTVYDSSHLGHARNYVSFDILRRILSDYFNYDVFSVMNITDVDDKIILKARRQLLFLRFADAHPKLTDEVLQQVGDAVRAEVEKNKKKREAVLQDEERTEQERVGEGALLAKKIAAAEALLNGDLAKAKKGDDSAALLERARDALSVALDDKEGHTVEDLDVREVAARFELEYLQDMQRLGVRMPDVLTRVSEFIPEIVAFVEKIIANGYGYESNGSVYFDTTKYMSDGHHDYPKLRPDAVGNARLLAEGEGALTAGAGDKRNPQDFALWKNSKPGEPVWESPWGKGRPGWHIECSAMAEALLGGTLDVHSGGQDLKFPHHDNEIAQCEAFLEEGKCKQWANYFFHSGHLHIEGLKMSKSLKNFITIRQALQDNTPRQLRLFFAMSKWDAVMDYKKDAMAQVRKVETNFASLFASASQLLREQQPRIERLVQKWGEEDEKLHNDLLQAEDDVHAAFCDNFNTGNAIQVLRNLATSTQRYLAAVGDNARAFLVLKVARYVSRILGVMGLTDANDTVGFESGSASGAAGDAILDEFAKFRRFVRDAAKEKAAPGKFLAATDELRDEVLPVLGVKFDDASDTLWMRIDPENAKREIRNRKELALTALTKKLNNAQRELDALVANAKPADSVIDRSLYGSFDEKGMPLTLADGTELTKSAKKSVSKAYNSQAKKHAKYEKLIAKNPDALKRAQDKVVSLTNQLNELRKQLE